MEEIFKELSKFSDEIITLGKEISDNRIELFASTYHLNLPEDFKIFMSKFNGINLMGTEILEFNSDNVNSIENTYYYEHFKVAVPMYQDLVPISPDGGGNFYCLNTSTQSKDGTCPIVFWVSNFIYTVNDQPEIVNENFLEWVKEVVIEWTLEDYDYNGTEKK